MTILVIPLEITGNNASVSQIFASALHERRSPSDAHNFPFFNSIEGNGFCRRILSEIIPHNPYDIPVPKGKCTTKVMHAFGTMHLLQFRLVVHVKNLNTGRVNTKRVVRESSALTSKRFASTTPKGTCSF